MTEAQAIHEGWKLWEAKPLVWTARRQRQEARKLVAEYMGLDNYAANARDAREYVEQHNQRTFTVSKPLEKPL